MNVSFLIYKSQDVLGDNTTFSQSDTIQVVPQIENLVAGVQYTITYTLEDPNGDVLPDVTFGFTSTSNLEVLAHVITLNQIGDYIDTITITRLDTGESSTFTEVISTSDFIEFSYNQCDTFVVMNKSTTKSASIEVTSLSGDSVLEPLVLAPGDSNSITFSAIGIYIVSVVSDSETFKYILNTFCLLDDCMSAFTLDLLCSDTRDCTCEYDSSAEIKLIRLFALKETYFMKLQKEFGFNNRYSGLSDSKLNELTTIDQVASKLALLCNRTYCLEGNCKGTATVNNSTNSLTGCGCS